MSGRLSILDPDAAVQVGPNRNHTLAQCCFDADPMSHRLVKRRTTIGPIPVIWCEEIKFASTVTVKKQTGSF